ncbi:MAG: hypothetical protein J7M14_01795 [Planctomycetes bacterium]|nr:hypothetical protein [Planctomycetota bacterium]
MVGYFYCLASVALLISFVQLLRYSQRKGIGVLLISMVNYVVAGAVTCTILAAWPVDCSTNERLIAMAMGLVSGALYFTHLLIILAAYRLAGVGITTALASMSIITPVLVSSFAGWDKAMSVYQWCAVAAVPVAMIQMRPSSRRRRRIGLKGDIVLVLVFLVPCIVGTLHKARGVYAPPSAMRVYQAALFSTAGLVSMAFVLAHRSRFGPSTKVGTALVGANARLRVTLLGTAMGMANLLATMCLLVALNHLPMAIVGPTSSSLVISLSLLVSWILWGERISKRQFLGFCVAILIVILANI